MKLKSIFLVLVIAALGYFSWKFLTPQTVIPDTASASPTPIGETCQSTLSITLSDPVTTAGNLVYRLKVTNNGSLDCDLNTPAQPVLVPFDGNENELGQVRAAPGTVVAQQTRW